MNFKFGGCILIVVLGLCAYRLNQPVRQPTARTDIFFRYATVSPELSQDIADLLAPGSVGDKFMAGLNTAGSVTKYLPALRYYHLSYDDFKSPVSLGPIHPIDMYYFSVKVNGKAVGAVTALVGANGQANSYGESQFGFCEAITNALTVAQDNQYLPAGTYEPRLILAEYDYILWLKAYSGPDYFYCLDSSMRFSTRENITKRLKIRLSKLMAKFEADAPEAEGFLPDSEPLNLCV